MSHDPQPVCRRTVLRGAAVGGIAVPLLAACGGDGGGSGRPAGAASPTEAEVPASEVPVGGGTILEDELVVVTQPADGEYKAFSAVCTHQGCPVQEITDGRIRCNCHGSVFSIEDGSVLEGPASSPLTDLSVTVTDGTVRVS